MALLMLLAACGADGGAPDAGPLPDAGPDDFHPERVGFVNLYEGGGAFLSVWAQLTDGPELPTPVLAAREGDCAVYVRPEPAQCQSCTTGVCTAPDVCTPYPAPLSAGPISIGGTVTPLRFTPGAFGYVLDGAQPQDLFTPGASITVSAPGDAAPAFSATLRAPPPLGDVIPQLDLVDGEDEVITWAAAGSGRVELSLMVGWHGAPFEALLRCETADDGSLTIPGALIAHLPRQTSALEQIPSWLARFDRRVVAGPLEITVASATGVYFTHRGAPTALPAGGGGRRPEPVDR